MMADNGRAKFATTKGQSIRISDGLAKTRGSVVQRPRGYRPLQTILRRRVNVYKVNFHDGLPGKKLKKESLASVAEMRLSLDADLLQTESLPSALVQELSKLDQRRKRYFHRAAVEARLVNHDLNGRQKNCTVPVPKLKLQRFVRDFGRQLLPPNLLGHPGNISTFLFNLRAMIGAGKGCTLRLGQFMRGLKTERVGWLEELNVLDRENLLARLVVHLVEDLFWPLLVGYFHVTESSRSRHEMHFFRKMSFQALFDRNIKQRPGLRLLSTSKAAIVAAKECAPGIARGRVLPKLNANDCRVIANKRKLGLDSKEGQEESETKLLLNLLKEKHPEVVDLRCRELHLRWRQFVANLTQGNESKLFFVRADVKDAYDSVDLDKLTDILAGWVKRLSGVIYVHTVR